MFLPNRRQFLTPLLFGALTFICLHLQFSSLGRWCLCLEPQPLKSILWSINLAWIVLRSTLILRAWFWASPKISVRLPAHTLMEMFFSQLKKISDSGKEADPEGTCISSTLPLLIQRDGDSWKMDNLHGQHRGFPESNQVARLCVKNVLWVAHS